MRIRAIKPGFFHNEDLAALSPLHRLAFAGLWCVADREGRLEDRPRRLKVEILPFDEVDFDRLLEDLAAGGFIVRYRVKQQRLIWIPTWKLHQFPRQDEKPSLFPAHLAPRKVTAPSLRSDGSATDQQMGNGILDLGNGNKKSGGRFGSGNGIRGHGTTG